MMILPSKVSSGLTVRSVQKSVRSIPRRKQSANPTDEAGWKAASQGTGGKITITGLTPGTILWVRVATVGPGGQLGAWSDPAKIVVA